MIRKGFPVEFEDEAEERPPAARSAAHAPAPAAARTPAADAILVGIDLGTHRTKVMTAQGAKFILRSVVGYPRDIIARKAVGEGPIFGKSAMKKRSFLDLVFPLADGVIQEASNKDYRAALELLRFAVMQAKAGENREVCGVIGVPARASFANKEMLLSIARQVMGVALVVSEPFMVAYQMDRLENCIVVDIGAGTIDICGMKGMVPAPEDQVTLLKGGDFIDERLADAIARRYWGVQVTKSIACAIKEEHAFVGEAEGPVVVNLRTGGKPADFDITEEVRAVCESIVPDIVENIENMIQKFDPEVQEDTLKNIILAGGGSRIRGLGALIEKQLAPYGEVAVTCVEDPDYTGAAGALKLATEVPMEEWSELGVYAGGRG